MLAEDLPPAAPAGSIGDLIALVRLFTRIVSAETAALRDGERRRFDALTERKREYFEVLQHGLANLERSRASASAAEREIWQTAAADCETALLENARLIETEQAHAAILLGEWRAAMQRRAAATLTYGRDARARPKP